MTPGMLFLVGLLVFLLGILSELIVAPKEGKVVDDYFMLPNNKEVLPCIAIALGLIMAAISGIWGAIVFLT